MCWNYAKYRLYYNLCSFIKPIRGEVDRESATEIASATHGKQVGSLIQRPKDSILLSLGYRNFLNM